MTRRVAHVGLFFAVHVGWPLAAVGYLGYRLLGG